MPDQLTMILERMQTRSSDQANSVRVRGIWIISPSGVFLVKSANYTLFPCHKFCVN